MANRMPESTHLAYIVWQEAWWGRVTYRDDPRVQIMAAHPDGGVAWEFAVEAVDLGSNARALRLQIFDDAFAALADIPELFARLATGHPLTLEGVILILRDLGAVDETPRENPMPTPLSVRQEIEVRLHAVVGADGRSLPDATRRAVADAVAPIIEEREGLRT